jgi:hypothetical protein
MNNNRKKTELMMMAASIMNESEMSSQKITYYIAKPDQKKMLEYNY